MVTTLCIAVGDSYHRINSLLMFRIKPQFFRFIKTCFSQKVFYKLEIAEDKNVDHANRLVEENKVLYSKRKLKNT